MRDIGLLIDMAKEVEETDPIDWDAVPGIDRDQAYFMIASQLFEMILHTKEDQRILVLMSSMVKVLAENFVLNLKTEMY
jgi:hypothetical protein